ncbi:MAG: hypothetical protein KC668_31815, partial [Myxococcales bacterium]|nr:hypothetical protein [Myxococcales bacterium]
MPTLGHQEEEEEEEEEEERVWPVRRREYQILDRTSHSGGAKDVTLVFYVGLRSALPVLGRGKAGEPLQDGPAVVYHEEILHNLGEGRGAKGNFSAHRWAR